MSEKDSLARSSGIYSCFIQLIKSRSAVWSTAKVVLSNIIFIDGTILLFCLLLVFFDVRGSVV